MKHTVPTTNQPGLLLFALLAAFLLLALAGCGRSRVDGGPYDGQPAPRPKSSTSRPAGTKPYTVMGKTYYPITDAHGYREEGIASWYGPSFHGKKTANGETYNMRSMTAAHKILPFGTTLRVTNLDNNRSITVRVNDRGPFVANRIIDLSRAGAEQLDMVGPGTARVRLESVGTIPGQKGNDLMGRFYVQVGAFARKDNAHVLARQVQQKGRPVRIIFVPDINFHRVQVGPYMSLSKAEAASDALQSDFPDNFVVAE